MDYNKIVIGALLAGSAILLYLYFRDRKVHPTPGTNRDPAPGRVPPSPKPTGSTRGDLVFFYADWCPHCDDMKGEWRETEASLLGKVNTKAIESRDPELSNHTIQGFPTIRYFPKGIKQPDVYIDYRGPRTADGMIQFVLTQ